MFKSVLQAQASKSPSPAQKYDDLQVSFGRCLRRHGFIERFYAILLASHPAIPPLFARTDVRGQRLALRRGISMAIAWASGSAMVERPMQHMIDVHARAGRAGAVSVLGGKPAGGRRRVRCRADARTARTLARGNDQGGRRVRAVCGPITIETPSFFEGLANLFTVAASAVWPPCRVLDGGDRRHPMKRELGMARSRADLWELTTHEEMG
jgi:hypothetical protein